MARAAAGTWVVVADEAIARIMVTPEDGGDLVDIEQITDPDAHAADKDLRRDAYGRRGGDDLRMGGNNTSSASDEQRHQEAGRFAKQVAGRLAQLHQQKHYEALQIVAAPRFLGALRKALPAEVEKTVTSTLDKDFVHFTNADIGRRLFGGG